MILVQEGPRTASHLFCVCHKKGVLVRGQTIAGYPVHEYMCRMYMIEVRHAGTMWQEETRGNMEIIVNSLEPVTY